MAGNSILTNSVSSTITTVGGTASVTIESSFGILSKIWINPTTATTKYDFKFTDFHNIESFIEEDIEGKYSETDVGEPVYSNFTLTIENANADEEFTYLLVFRTA